MTTELFRKVEETVTVDGIEEKRTTSVEYILRDEDREVGRLNVSEWGVNFNVSKAIDVDAMAEDIINILTTETV